MADLIEFQGRSFKLADKVGLMPLMRFAHFARKGLDSADMEGLNAIYSLLQSVIADEDWQEFEDHASATRADDEDLLQLVKDAIEIMSARPTVRPSDSSDGPLIVNESSADDLPSRVIRRHIEAGRPRLALAVYRAQQYHATG